MSESQLDKLAVAGLSGGAVLGAAVGALAAYFLNDAISAALQRRKWIVPLVGGLAGATAGGILLGRRLSQFAMAGASGGAIAGGAAGAVTAYFLADGLQYTMQSNPWALPVLVGLSGAAAGSILSGRLMQ